MTTFKCTWSATSDSWVQS